MFGLHNLAITIVEVKVSSQVLGDPGNNELSYDVSVKDYHDIVVDLSWLDSSGEEINGAVEGTADVDFKITVDLQTSIPQMNIRTTNLSIQITNGDVDGSTSILQTIGVTKTVTTSDDGEGNTVTDSRQIIGHDEDITTLGTFWRTNNDSIPPADGSYSVSVSIQSRIMCTIRMMHAQTVHVRGYWLELMQRMSFR